MTRTRTLNRMAMTRNVPELIKIKREFAWKFCCCGDCCCRMDEQVNCDRNEASNRSDGGIGGGGSVNRGGAGR